MPEYRAAAVPRPARREMPPLEFPGCRPVRISRADLERCERRIEYWDAATETAMICDPVSVYHERPGQRLRELATRIAQLRGSPIETFGAADLLLRDAGGAWLRILEADQTVYLHPRTTRPPGAQDRGGQRHAAGRRAGGRQHHRRAPRQAVAVRVVGLPGGVGRGARAVLAEPPGRAAPRLDDLPAGGRRLPWRGAEPSLRRLDGAGDPPGAERTGVVAGHADRATARGAGARGGQRHGAGRRSTDAR